MRPRTAIAARWKGGWDEGGLARWAESVRARLDAPAVTFATVFLSPALRDVAADVIEVLRLHARLPLLVGCSSTGLVVNGEELEDDAGLVLGLHYLPRAGVRAFHLTQENLEKGAAPGHWNRWTGLGPSDVRGWLMLADPGGFDGERWLSQWNAAFPGIPMVGGLAGGPDLESGSQLFIDGQVYCEGVVVLGLTGAVDLETVVSQGCTPIGEPWIITETDRNFILRIGNQPAYHVLLETFNGLSREEQARAQGNLFVGFASSEYREDFRRGDFLVRNLMGADPKQGVLAVGAVPRVGQTIQFQRRDPAAATEDLGWALARARERLGGRPVVGGFLFVCHGRGHRLFGSPHHDAGLLQEQLGPLPVTGFFCHGEVGPVGGRNFLHGYTAAAGVLVSREN